MEWNADFMFFLTLKIGNTALLVHFRLAFLL